MEQRNGKSGIRRIIIIILVVVMLVSGGMTIHHYMEDQRVKAEYDRLVELARETTAPSGTEASTEEPETEPEVKPYVSPINFDELKEENPDTIEWIRVPDTNIDHPIVRGTDNDFYLDYDFYGEESIGGAIYLDLESQGDFVGHNNIPYGHNMKNGSMSKDVVCYKEEDYFKGHQYFSIYTPDREIRSKAVVCCYGEAQPTVRKTCFKFQKFFDAFVHEMIKPCSYAVDITYLAKTLYTLVTCSYEISDVGAFFLAVEVGEDGREIGPDEEFLQKMDDLMKAKQQEAAQAKE